MAQYRQSGVVFGSRGYDLNGASDHVSLGVRATATGKSSRPRRFARSDKTRRISVGAIVAVLALALLLTLLAYSFLSTEHKEIITNQNLEDDFNDSDFLTNVTRMDSSKVLNFGKGSVAHGRDSRYWDRDDRRRDEDYSEDLVDHTNVGSNRGHVPLRMKNENKSSLEYNRKNPERGLYNEAGRNELKRYEAEYEASLKNVGSLMNENGNRNQLSHEEDLGMQNDAVDVEDEYDDGIDLNDARTGEYDETGHDRDYSKVEKLHNGDGRESFTLLSSRTKDRSIVEQRDEASTNSFEDLSLISQDSLSKERENFQHAEGQSPPKKSRSYPKGKPKRHKYSGSSCEMKLLNSTAQLVEPLESRKFTRFSLQYTEREEKPSGQENWEPRFSGHQSLKEREECFLARDQKINCGFVKGPKGSPSTGFDVSEDDASYMSKCHIAVISCIFGNSDRLRTPTGKTVTRLSRKNVCFVMFMDEVTLHTLSSEGHMPDTAGYIGLWKIVVVKNLPFTDMRRVGKIPKLLPHRLFPSARYSIWLDSKLRLQRDPLLILEYFLWRKGHEYAISNHYDRHCVWEEVAQNKKLNKYNHTVIDQQFEFYQADGLKRFNTSDPNKLLSSNVPEGSFIARAHTPMANLFSCLWFNEVDRFTPRDQLSFAYTHQKLVKMNPSKQFHLNMFKDCERRAIAKLFRHRSEEKRKLSLD